MKILIAAGQLLPYRPLRSRRLDPGANRLKRAVATWANRVDSSDFGSRTLRFIRILSTSLTKIVAPHLTCDPIPTSYRTQMEFIGNQEVL